MGAVWFCVITAILVFVPVFFTVYEITDLKNKKVYFSITFFGFNLIGGYITIDLHKINIHIGEKFVFVVNIADKLKDNLKLIKIKHIELYDIKTVFKFEDNNSDALYMSGIWWALFNNICPLISYTKDFIDINNDIVITKKEECSFYIKCSFFTNLFSLILLLINNLSGKVNAYVGRKK